MNLKITHTVHVRDHALQIDDDPAFITDPELSFPEMVRTFYEYLNLRYRKFYKMDELSQLGFLAAEALMQRSGTTGRYEPADIGVVLSNAAASLDTDRKHQLSVDNPEGIPASPAVFVYTLPNIVIGEICIRHGVTGENAFFIFEDYDPGSLSRYVEDLVRSGKMEACLAGWVDRDEDRYEAFLYTVEKEEVAPDVSPHEPEALQALYHKPIR